MGMCDFMDYIGSIIFWIFESDNNHLCQYLFYFQLKAKLFENSEPTEQVNLEEEKLRKESFQKAKEAFIDVEECSDAIDGSLTITDESPENEDCSEDGDEEEKRRKAEFEAKQKLFNGENNSWCDDALLWNWVISETDISNYQIFDVDKLLDCV